MCYPSNAQIRDWKVASSTLKCELRLTVVLPDPVGTVHLRLKYICFKRLLHACSASYRPKILFGLNELYRHWLPNLSVWVNESRCLISKWSLWHCPIRFHCHRFYGVRSSYSGNYGSQIFIFKWHVVRTLRGPWDALFAATLLSGKRDRISQNGGFHDALCFLLAQNALVKKREGRFVKLSSSDISFLSPRPLRFFFWFGHLSCKLHVLGFVVVVPGGYWLWEHFLLKR